MSEREKTMKSGSLIRVSLRLMAVAAVLAAGGYFLRPKPTLLPKSVAATAYTPPAPIVSDEWAHLRQAKVEPITFPGYRIRSTDTYDWLPDGRALLVRYIGEQNCIHKLYAASPKIVTPLQNFNRVYSGKLYAHYYSGIHAEEDHQEPEITPPYCALSPDGKRLLWLEDDYPHTNLEGMYNSPQTMAAAALDGSTFREWEYTKVFPHWAAAYDNAVYNENEARWLRDS